MEENKAQANDYADHHGSVEEENRVEEAVEQLIGTIKQSDVYRRYQDIRLKVHQEPDKERAIHEFRRRNYLLQSSKEEMDLFEEIDRFDQEFAALRSEPLVEEYLSAELAFCRLIQSMNWKLMESLEFDLGYFGE